MPILNSIVNGDLSSIISIQDRGFNYGDGVFETIAFVEQKLVFWKEHYQRLLLGCDALGIICPSEESLKIDIKKLCESVDEKQNCVIKIIVTRGDGERGYKFNSEIEANVIASLSTFPSYPNDFWINGITVKYCKTKLSEQKQLAGIKHLNRLDQLLARREWDDECQEGLLSDAHGNLIEGVMSNVFIVKDNSILTPFIDNAGVNGIMRNVILNLCESNGIIAKEAKLTYESVLDADEVFLTNSLVGVWPVTTIDKQSFSIGNCTKNLIQLLIKEYSINYATLSI